VKLFRFHSTSSNGYRQIGSKTKKGFQNSHKPFLPFQQVSEPVAQIPEQSFIVAHPSGWQANFTVLVRQIACGSCHAPRLYHHLSRNTLTASPIVRRADEFPFLRTCCESPTHKVSDTTIVLDLTENRFHGMASFLIKLSPPAWSGACALSVDGVSDSSVSDPETGMMRQLPYAVSSLSQLL